MPYTNAQAEAFWQNVFAGAWSTPRLLFDHSAQGKKIAQGTAESTPPDLIVLRLDVADDAALSAIAEARSAPIEAVIFAAWLFLLHLATDQSELVIGVDVGVSQLLPLRLTVDPEISFAEHLDQVLAAWKLARTYSDYPFANLAGAPSSEMLVPGRPIYPVIFVGQIASAEALHITSRHYQPFELLSPADRERIPAGVEDAYPLSMLQAGLIYQNELAYGTAQYHDIISYIIQSPFNAEVFEQTRILVARHPIFRTSYHITGFDEYVQMVHQRAELPLQIVDLRHLDDAEQERWYQQWVSDRKAHRFVWEHPDLVRMYVHVLRDDMYRYTFSQHNSALDGWSITLLLSQRFDIYYRLMAHEPYNDSPIANHLRNYIGLERQAIASAENCQFWNKVLHGSSFTKLPRWQPEQPSQGLSVVFHT